MNRHAVKAIYHFEMARMFRGQIEGLTEELSRVRQENQDLRQAADIWIRLYERQLTRANEAASPGSPPPASQ